MSLAVPQGWESLSQYYDYLKESDASLGAFIGLRDLEKIQTALEASEGPLAGIPFGVKDNIALEGEALTCGSRMLETFISPYSATAVRRLEAAGAVAVGKTNLDEFGMGSSCDTSALKTTNNPWDLGKVAGGSSGGSAAAVAAGMVPFALGSDTGGSVRQPAAFCGTYGLKPTYGQVSRYGLVAYASSLEVIGILSLDLELLRQVFQIIRGKDKKDQSSRDLFNLPAKSGGPKSLTETQESTKAKGSNKKVLGILGNLEGLEASQKEAYTKALEQLSHLGYELKTVDLSTLQYVVPAYYTIASAEASANLARYAGIRYGYRTDWAEEHGELTEKSRDQGFGDEVKMRILLGTYVLRSGFKDQYYLRAQKIRTLIVQEMRKLFGEVDQLLTPVYPTGPFTHGQDDMDSYQQKLADKFTATANLAGIPALAFPAGEVTGLPFGLQLMGPEGSEEQLLDSAAHFAQLWPPKTAPGFRPWKRSTL